MDGLRFRRRAPKISGVSDSNGKHYNWNRRVEFRISKSSTLICEGMHGYSGGRGKIEAWDNEEEGECCIHTLLLVTDDLKHKEM